MKHLDPELLALLALGEDAASPADRMHLAGCAECRAEVRRLARPVAATREDDPALAAPAPRVWAGIAAELRLDPALHADPLQERRLRAVPSGARAPRRRRAGAIAGARALRGRRAAVIALLSAAAAVVVIGAVAIGLLALRPGEQRIASATLDAFPGWPGRSGTAVLERLPNGREVVEVQTTVQPDTSTDHEVWLMTDGARRLVPLGLLHGTSGTFTVPAGVDPSRFHLVDVSDEPRDGNPAHSGDSIIRGALRS